MNSKQHNNNLLLIRRKLACEYDQMRLTILYNSKLFYNSQIKLNQMKCWFLERGENRSTRRKTCRSRVENQQTQPTYDAEPENRARDTLVEGERSHHYANPAPLTTTTTTSLFGTPRFIFTKDRKKIKLNM